jgi:hypothetical protein
MPGGQTITPAGASTPCRSFDEMRRRNALGRPSADRDLPLPAPISATNVQTCEFTALSSVSRTDIMFCKDLRRFSLLVR